MQRPLPILVAALCFAPTVLAAGSAIDPARSPTTSAHATASFHRRAAKPQHGKISWYGRRFEGHRTASGEPYDPRAMTMAHRFLPLGAIVDVTNNANGEHVRVRVNDRGPYVRGRVADLSRAASKRLGFKEQGVTDATIRVVRLPAAESIANDATTPSVAAPSGPGPG